MVYQHFAGYCAISANALAPEEESKVNKDESNSAAAASSDLGLSETWEVIDSSESPG